MAGDEEPQQRWWRGIEAEPISGRGHGMEGTCIDFFDLSCSPVIHSRPRSVRGNAHMVRVAGGHVAGSMTTPSCLFSPVD